MSRRDYDGIEDDVQRLVQLYQKGGKSAVMQEVARMKLKTFEMVVLKDKFNAALKTPGLKFDGFGGDDMKTMMEFIIKHDLHMSCKPDHNFTPKDDWQRSASHWTCTIEKIGKYDAHAAGKLTTSFHMGSAHSGEPEIADVLSSLALDASSALSAQDAYDMARDLGMELETAQDKLKARNIYSACTATHRKLVKLLGEAATKELIYETEPL